MDPELPQYEFFIDAEAGDFHFAKHGISADDVLDALENAEIVQRGRDDTYEAYGQTRNGLWLEVIYVERGPMTLRIITAYTLAPKALRALRRRLRKKR